VPLEPLHPDEPALHHALRDALNRQLTDTDFFVWINVTPTGERTEFDDLSSIVRRTEQWLSSLSPESVEPETLPEKEFSDRAAEIKIRAIPKKPAARGSHPPQIVGNPEPALAGWV
jgi:hypothetical protein